MRIGCLLLIMAFPSVFAGEAKPSDIEGVWCRDATSAFQLGVHDKNAGLTFDKQGCWHIHIEHADHDGGVAKLIVEKSTDKKNAYPVKRDMLEIFDATKHEYTTVAPLLLGFYMDGSNVRFSVQELAIDKLAISGTVEGSILKFVQTIPANGVQLSTASVKYVKLHKVKDHVGEDFNDQWQALTNHLAQVKSKHRREDRVKT